MGSPTHSSSMFSLVCVCVLFIGTHAAPAPQEFCPYPYPWPCISNSESNRGKTCIDGGIVYEEGQSWTCSDGCNRCWCSNGAIAQTLAGCSVVDLPQNQAPMQYGDWFLNPTQRDPMQYGDWFLNPNREPLGLW